MDEFQLIETYREGFAVAWAQLQWWASVSFGLLAMASFGRKHLSLAVTNGLSILYLLFSVFSLLNVYLVLVPTATAAADLSQLEGVSNVGASVFNNKTIGQSNALIAMVCFVATFCGTLTYLWHSYRKNKAAAT